MQSWVVLRRACVDRVLWKSPLSDPLAEIWRILYQSLTPVTDDLGLLRLLKFWEQPRSRFFHGPVEKLPKFVVSRFPRTLVSRVVPRRLSSDESVTRERMACAHQVSRPTTSKSKGTPNVWFESLVETARQK